LIALERPKLDPAESDYLLKKSRAIAEVEPAEAKQVSKDSWSNKSDTRFAQIRKMLESAAPGRGYCMYCLDSEATSIDHFRPRSEHPYNTFDWDNYVLACSHCNSNEKREQFPVDHRGSHLLLNPFEDDPQMHLHLDIVLGERTARTARGLTTIEVFNLNRTRLTQGRIDAWRSLNSLLRTYHDLRESGKDDQADAYLVTIQRAPFAEVLSEMRRLAQFSPSPLPDGVRDMLIAHPEL
jgi:uncharacterized protein (TIGR02646 family)